VEQNKERGPDSVLFLRVGSTINLESNPNGKQRGGVLGQAGEGKESFVGALALIVRFIALGERGFFCEGPSGLGEKGPGGSREIEGYLGQLGTHG